MITASNDDMSNTNATREDDNTLQVFTQTKYKGSHAQDNSSQSRKEQP